MTNNSDLPVGLLPLSADAQILHDRARLLARPPNQEAAADTMLEVLEFCLGEERFAVETRHVREVYPLKDLTPLPGTPSFVVGIVNVRGHILPVFDLKKFFDMPEQGLSDLHRIVIVHGQGLELGLLTDITVGVRTISVQSLQPSLPTLTGVRADYLKGVSSERLVVLDLPRILADPKIVVHEEVEN